MMARSNFSVLQKFELSLSLVRLGIILIFFRDCPFGIETLPTVVFSQQLDTIAQAQIIPDQTLGNENSQVVAPEQNINGVPVQLIEGGARRGVNLFHSFSQFNIETGRGTYFANPEGITNIFSRVTGSDTSNILGTLGVNGDADLFLLNPNGIIFGENASLDVNGSFLATIANEIQFGGRGEFSATNPDIPALLTVNPSAFLFNQINSGTIENRSTAPAGFGILENPLSGLRVSDGESLLFLGGEINMNGGRLTSQDGRIELVAILGEATIGLNTKANNLAFDLPPQFQLTDIVLRNGAGINTAGEGDNNTVEDQNSENISIRARNLILNNSLISADTLGFETGRDITIESKQLLLQNGSTISNVNLGEVSEGNINIKTDNLEIGELSRINNSNIGQGNGGNISIETSSLLITDGGQILNETLGSGNAGDLNINAQEIEISFSSQASGSLASRISGLFVSTLSDGNGGELSIFTENLTVKNGAAISAGNFSSLEPNPTIPGQGNAGNIQITASSIQLEDGALLSTETFSGLGGNISLQIENTLFIKGDSLISAQADGEGDGGNIDIDSGFLVAFSPGDLDGNDIIANAVLGQGGNINIFTQGIFGIESRENLTPFNDITASSEFGLSGTVEINTLEIDPSQNSLDLPLELIETEVTRTCKPYSSGSQSEFAISGRGGLPNSHKDFLETDTGLEDWRVDELAETSSNLSDRGKPNKTEDNESKQIIEAQSWKIGDHGQIILVADATATTSSGVASTRQNCSL